MNASVLSDCPLCGKSAPDDWGIDVDPCAHGISYCGKRIHLSRKAFVMFQLLYTKRGTPVSAKAFRHALYGLDPNGGPEWDAVRVGIFYLRRQLKQLGLFIDSVMPRGTGYALRRPAALHNEMHAFLELLEGRAGIVRAGPNAKETGDPFDSQCTFEIMGDGFAILKAYAGPVSRARVEAAIRSLNAVGLKARWERLNGRAHVLGQAPAEEGEQRIAMRRAQERKRSGGGR
jgi:hypothetical protein